MYHLLLHEPPTPYHLKVTAKLVELTLEACDQGHDIVAASSAVLRHVTNCNLSTDCLAKSLSLEAAYFGTSVVIFATEVWQRSKSINCNRKGDQDGNI